MCIMNSYDRVKIMQVGSQKLKKLTVLEAFLVCRRIDSDINARPRNMDRAYRHLSLRRRHFLDILRTIDSSQSYSIVE